LIPDRETGRFQTSGGGSVGFLDRLFKSPLNPVKGKMTAKQLTARVPGTFLADARQKRFFDGIRKPFETGPISRRRCMVSA